MKKLLICVLLSFSILQLAAQDKPTIQIVTGEATDELTDKISLSELKKNLKELATINALENAYGTAVIQGNTINVQGKSDGSKAGSNNQSSFNIIGNTIVKGEVVEELECKYSDDYRTTKVEGKKIEHRYIKCTIKAKAREIEDAPVVFEAYPVACENSKCKTNSFKTKDAMYFYFKSPVSGYLSIFIDNNKTSDRILPYSKVPADFENGIPVEADKEYIFFSNKFNYFPDKPVLVDELEMSTDQEQESDLLFVVFSTKPIAKPSLKENFTIENLTAEEIKKRYTVPKSMGSSDFQRWKVQNMVLRKDMRVVGMPITISNK